jgi:hypothetical protein
LFRWRRIRRDQDHGCGDGLDDRSHHDRAAPIDDAADNDVTTDRRKCR